MPVRRQSAANLPNANVNPYILPRGRARVAPRSEFERSPVGGGTLDAPCRMSETQKGGHKALPYIIYKKNPQPKLWVLCWRYLSSRVGQVLSWRRKCPVDTFRQNCKINKKPHTFVCGLYWRCLSFWVGQVLRPERSGGSAFGACVATVQWTVAARIDQK